jgi:peptidase E
MIQSWILENSGKTDKCKFKAIVHLPFAGGDRRYWEYTENTYTV